MGNNIKNFVDEKTNRTIVDALMQLDFKSVNKLAEDSAIPVHRLQAFIEGSERITQVDKGSLILHLVDIDMTTQEKSKDPASEQFTSLDAFRRRKTG